ncbi:DnaD domain protein [Lysinibacillus sp. KU-BSD001]|uniref:DnaD domain protein n=1 Tax=Lysinibacillus sp. KU-BSD001 TaxID=3141328 RepID=UPI0036F00F16
MTTFRINKTENFVVLDKGFLNNPQISWQAKGLLAYMLSLPNDWTFNIADLTTRSKNGRDATKAIVKELQEAGYIQKEQSRSERGKFGQTVFLVFETPNKQPSTENPLTVNPTTEQPLTENSSLISNNKLNNNLLNNYDDDKATPQQPKKLNAFAFYEQNGFGALSAYVLEKMNAWLDDLSEELVIHAMKLAIENNAIRWNYVETILKDWSNKRLKTISDVQADKLRYEAQKQQRRQQPPRKQQGRQEVVPEWFANRNEQQPAAPASGIATNADIDFERERQKVLAKLGD